MPKQLGMHEINILYRKESKYNRDWRGREREAQTEAEFQLM